jgi:hypothetical protein
MQNAFRAFNQHFQPDTPSRKSNVLLNLREQPVRKEHVRCILYFGNHDDINISPGCFHNFDYVTIEKLCVNPIRAEGANLAMKVESGKGLDQRFSCSNFLRRSAAIFQIEDDLIGLAGCCLGHHLERMRGAREFTAPNRDSVGVI